MVPSNGIHTIGLLFPIDLIYLDAENRVIPPGGAAETVPREPHPIQQVPVCWNCLHTIYASGTRVEEISWFSALPRKSKWACRRESGPGEL